MSEKNYVKLLGKNGEARKYFKDAVNGAAWVDHVLDEIVSQLSQRYVTIVSADTTGVQELLDVCSTHPRFKGFTLYSGKGGGLWQASIAIDSSTNFMVKQAPDAFSAMCGVYFAFMERVLSETGN